MPGGFEALSPRDPVLSQKGTGKAIESCRHSCSTGSRRAGGYRGGIRSTCSPRRAPAARCCWSHRPVAARRWRAFCRLSATSRSRPDQGLNTLYVSPLKALAVDIARNLERPVARWGCRSRIETRTGDTPPAKRQRQRHRPPDILITTPEQVALLFSMPDAPRIFGTFRRVIFDELHALVASKRGALLSLGLARLQTLAPRLATSVFRPPLPMPMRCAPGSSRKAAGGCRATRRPGAGCGRGHARDRHSRHRPPHPLGRPFGAPRLADIYGRSSAQA